MSGTRFPLGFYTPEIHETSVEALFARVRALGGETVQYNFLSSHGEELPVALTKVDARRIGEAARACGVTISAVNGTFNMLEPEDRLQEDLRRFRLLAGNMQALGCSALTLCTGSYSEKGMWVFDERNGSDEALERAVQVTRLLLKTAREYDLRLLVETEASNAVCDSSRARRYLDELDDAHMGVILDCANLFPAGTARRENVRPTIRRAFELLGDRLVLAHGKDVLEGEKPAFTAPGLGIVDYPYFFAELEAAGYAGPLILHGIKQEAELEGSAQRMRRAMEERAAV